MGSLSAKHGWAYKAQTRPLVVFALDRDVALPAQPPPLLPTPVADGDFVLDPALATGGGPLYAQLCVVCHGAGAVSGGVAPDIRASRIVLSRDAFEEVVLRGALRATGMSRFPTLTPDEAESIRHYVRSMARAAGTGGVR
jgi:quinohemoprotein ethanol dehydrogenase